MKVIWMIVPLILFGTIGIQQSFADVEYSHEFNFENCEGILGVEEIKSAINRIEEITVNSRALTPVDREPNLQTMCDSTFESEGKSISMTIVVMESGDTASTLYEKNLDAYFGQNFDFRQYVTFWNNFDVTVNDQNVGSFIISQYDKFFINFHTSFEGDGPALIDTDELRTLSTIVQKKILDLDDVSISPPNPVLDNDVGPTTDEPPISPPSLPPIEEGVMTPPKKQVLQGIKPTAVTCNEGLVLIIKHNGSPACVMPETAKSLEMRGWGGMPPPCCKPTTVSISESFEECVAAGNPVMEAHPRKCRALDGKEHVEIFSWQTQCEISGGLWGIWNNISSATSSCNHPTSDEGISCTDSSQCQSYCQVNDGAEINSDGVGICHGYELAVCMQEVRNGTVQPEWCQ